jgi:hypothetical protein
MTASGREATIRDLADSGRPSCCFVILSLVARSLAPYFHYGRYVNLAPLRPAVGAIGASLVVKNPGWVAEGDSIKRLF